MKIDIKQLKINMLVNLVREYIAIKKVASVGVLESNYVLYIECVYGIGGASYEIDIAELLKLEVESMVIEFISKIESVLFINDR